MAISFSARLVVPAHVLLQRVGEEAVLLNLENELYFGLDPVGMRMWEALSKSRTLEGAYQELLGVYEVDDARLRKDLEALVAKLVENGLVQTEE